MDAVAAAKLALRDQLLTTRRRRGLFKHNRAAHAIAEQLLSLPAMQRAATIAAYVSMADEPGTGPLVDAWDEAGRHTLLPVLLGDNDLDWAWYRGSGSLVSASRGLLEPRGERLGVDAIARADAVIVPGLAADRTGMRLGRGGGSYDRALARVPVGTPVLVLLYDDEILDEVPRSGHDRPVTAAVTPSGVHWF